MNRIAAALVILAGLLVATAAGGDPVPRPNLLVILSDDMNWHLPGFQGGLASTPNLDSLPQSTRPRREKEVSR